MPDHAVKHLVVPLPLAEAAAIVDHALRIGQENGMLPLMYAHLFSLSYVTDLFSQGSAKAAERADA